MDNVEAVALRKSLSSALRFAASRSAITANDEKAILAAFDAVAAIAAMQPKPAPVVEAAETKCYCSKLDTTYGLCQHCSRNPPRPAASAMRELIERIEAGTAEQQRELLWEAFYVIYPAPEPEQYLVDNVDWTWDRLRKRFHRMIDAEAYESAALMLVPEGMVWSFSVEEPGPWAWVGKAGAATPAIMAATPALALAAAALRAQEASRGD